ncbi:MAG TPA: hypothetical protein VJX92_00710 [Methylomirabilota bacterium]|nr:hypothetical protein [Methylomirabilota bacterium]
MAEGLGVGTEVAAEEAGTLPRALKLGDAAAEGREKTEIQDRSRYRIIRLSRP